MKTTYHHFPVLIEPEFNTVDEGFYAVPDSVPVNKLDNGEYRLAGVLPRDDEGEQVIPDEYLFLSDDEEEANRILALFIATGYGPDGASYDDSRHTVEVGSKEWLVVTDDEADELWDQDLENYLDECVLHEMPEMAQRYFDREAWKRDARIDGRAHSLNRYDGNEEWEEINGTTYYIYRQN